MDVIEKKRSLEQSREILQQRLERVAVHTRCRVEPLPQDFAEQAVALENDELMVSLDDDIENRLVSIKRALQRIQMGLYTSCANCGNEIPDERLNAIPDTHLCFPCANKQD